MLRSCPSRRRNRAGPRCTSLRWRALILRTTLKLGAVLACFAPLTADAELRTIVLENDAVLGSGLSYSRLGDPAVGDDVDATVVFPAMTQSMDSGDLSLVVVRGTNVDSFEAYDWMRGLRTDGKSDLP